jgi:hypothetical protein
MPDGRSALCCPLLLFVTVVIILIPGMAAAQSEGRFGIGPQISFHFPVSRELENSTGFGIAYRLTRPSKEDGWRPITGFGWFGADFAAPLGGHLTVRPVMAGASYVVVRGKLRGSFATLTGYAFVAVKVNDEQRFLYSAEMGTTVAGVDAKNTWAVKSGVRIAYDVRRRFGVFVAGDYELVRPTLLIRTPAETRERSLNADTVNVTIGFMVGVF